ncbi:MAG TPA: alanine racemase [Blastocatellia bacterium]|nr:alanine racemase [Blastocatellia bacterium]
MNDSQWTTNEEPIEPARSPADLGRPTWAEVNLNNLLHNFRLMKQLAGSSCAMMPALKADAYGHGAIECALALEDAGADWFGVALPEEGLKLRQAGVTRPILCLGGVWAGQENLCIAEALTPVVYRVDQAEALDRAAKSAGTTIRYHLKVDTGMGRLGVPFPDVRDFLERANRLSSATLDGVMTHLASADEAEKTEYTLAQLDRLRESVKIVRQFGHRPAWIHAGNGAATHAVPQCRAGLINMVRPGGVLYGLWRDVTNRSVEPLDWWPVMSLRTRIAMLREVPAGTPLGYGGTFVTGRPTKVATLPIGYEDGLMRALSNTGRALIRGRPAPIIGRVSMDLTLVDVSEVPGAALSDEAVLIGRQGVEEITAEEVASLAGTISYEVTCGISDRVPRVFLR